MLQSFQRGTLYWTAHGVLYTSSSNHRWSKSSGITPDGAQGDFPGSVAAHAVPAHAGDVAVLHGVLIVADSALECPLGRPRTLERHSCRCAAVALRALNEVDRGLQLTLMSLDKLPST